MFDPSEHFERLYDAGRASWDIGRPQPAFAALVERGALRGRVLDVGCGTGENTLLAAAAGLDATGVDAAANALRAARDKAAARGLHARFVQHDVLDLTAPSAGLVEPGSDGFDTAIDSLVLHAFVGEERMRYVDGLHAVLRPGGRLYVLSYGPGPVDPPVPHWLTRDDIDAAFAGRWRLDAVEDAVCMTALHPDGVPGFLTTATRL